MEVEKRTLKVQRAFLVYQAGIANVFEVESLNLRDYGRDAKRLLQSDFRSCESFARGLGAAGTIVRSAAANLAGDITHSDWTEDLESQPFSDHFHPVNMGGLHSEKEEKEKSPRGKSLKIL